MHRIVTEKPPGKSPLSTYRSRMAMSASIVEKTFQNEDILPSLPVPSLEETLNKYLDSVKPHVTQQEYKTTEDVVRAFGAGNGKKLHEKLLEKAKNERNWLEHWWEMHAYLSSRTSTAVYNMCGPMPSFEDRWPPENGTWLEICSLTLHYTFVFWKMLREEKVPVEKEKGASSSLSMNQYRNLFNTCKVPAKEVDNIVRHFKTESEGSCPHHIVIMRNGRFYTFSILDDNGKVISAPEIQRQLEYVKSACDSQPSIPSVGMLTALNRTSWAEMRDYLITLDSRNRMILEVIESSVMMLSLEDVSAKSVQQVCYQGMCGNGHARWFDKCYTLQSYQDGTLSTNCDHAVMDGMAVIGLNYFVEMQIESSGGKWQGSTNIGHLPVPQELKFNIDNKVLAMIQEAAKFYRMNADNVDIVYRWVDFDRSILKAKKIHSDAFIQLSIQLAYYMTYHRPAPTYETATTRQFYHGRTETVRSCTVEAIQWCKCMLDETTTSHQRMQLFNKALRKHKQLMKEAKNNHGCDRHLLGLQILAMESGLPIPQIFQDPSYVKSGGNGNYILSTSFTGYTTELGFVPPMCQNGYGVFYCIPQQQVRIIVTSWKSDRETDSERFEKTWENCLNQMFSIVINSKL